MKSQKSKRKAGGVSKILGGELQLFSMPVKPETSITCILDWLKIQPPSPLAIPPKISVIFKDSSNIKFGYFDKLEFLDNRADFAEVIVDNPKILAPNIITLQDTTSSSRSLYSFDE